MLFSFLKPSPDAVHKVPENKIKKVYFWHQIGVLCALCVGYIGYYVIRLIFTVEQNNIRETYGFTTADIGLVLSCFGIGYGISKLFMGALSDKSNAIKYLATGLVLSAIFNVGFATTKNLYVMMILMLLMSIAQGMGAAACQRSIQLWWGKKYRGTVYSIWSSAHNAGAFACVAVVQFSAFLFVDSLAAVFYTASVVSILIAIFILLAGRERPEVVGLPSISEFTGDKVLNNDNASVNSYKTELNLFKIFTHYILNNPLVWAITLTSMSLYLVRFGVMSWIPSYLVESKGFNPDFTKWLIGVFELSAVPGVILMGAISDFLKNKRALVCLICLLGLIACLSFYFFSNSHVVIVIVLFIMGTLIYAPLTLVGLMVNEAVPKFAVGSSTGFMGFFQYIVGETLATALIGILVHQYGWSASNVVLYCAVALSIILLIYIMIKETKLSKQTA